MKYPFSWCLLFIFGLSVWTLTCSDGGSDSDTSPQTPVAVMSVHGMTSPGGTVPTIDAITWDTLWTDSIEHREGYAPFTFWTTTGGVNDQHIGEYTIRRLNPWILIGVSHDADENGCGRWRFLVILEHHHCIDVDGNGEFHVGDLTRLIYYLFGDAS